ncbi:MAG TPA: glycosyltransferase family 2 protein, partial [Corynebacterium amycolatum]|nr:glycosyltransferase family 2 protein [Corynebacterium amycolatum]
MSEKYTVGISVIVPSFAGRARLPRLIECLNQQSLDPRLFEVIVVLNGPDDSSAAYLRGLTTDYDLRIINTTGVGAAHARNVGLASVTREYLTFVDDDDALEPEFLATGFRLSKPQEAVLLPMRDIGEDGRHHDSALSARISQGAGRTQLARVIPWALGFNACKILPSHIVTRFRFDEELKSG